MKTSDAQTILLVEDDENDVVLMEIAFKRYPELAGRIAASVRIGPDETSESALLGKRARSTSDPPSLGSDRPCQSSNDLRP